MKFVKRTAVLLLAGWALADQARAGVFFNRGQQTYTPAYAPAHNQYTPAYAPAPAATYAPAAPAAPAAGPVEATPPAAPASAEPAAITPVSTSRSEPPASLPGQELTNAGK